MISIETQRLGKIFHIYRKPSDRLKEALLRRPFHQAFHALSEVSFQLRQGETLGIIGENGAGKSTLLKLLTGTLTPSAGRITCNGRIAALLELGSGFHPEFTGRQNIYLNGSLLGLSEAEIREREAAIIEFAELGPFIDRPVKTYSSGMNVRLGFAVATSVDPEILIIDEALSVGDARFQKKCIERMRGFKEQGKTLLFCSHSMYLVKQLCERAIWLAGGRIRAEGDAAEVINQYMTYLEDKEAGGADARGAGGPRAAGAGRKPRSSALPEVLIEDMVLRDARGERADGLRQFEAYSVEVTTRCTGEPARGHLGVGLVRTDGQLFFGALTKAAGLAPLRFEGTQRFVLHLPRMTVGRGRYQLKGYVGDEDTLRLIDEHAAGYVVASGEHPELGTVWVDHRWELPESAEAAAPTEDAAGERGAR